MATLSLAMRTLQILVHPQKITLSLILNDITLSLMLSQSVHQLRCSHHEPDHQSYTDPEPNSSNGSTYFSSEKITT